MDKVKIPIDAKVLYQMYEYADYARRLHQSEIAGWAHYNKDRGIYKLTPLLRQEASGAEVIAFPNSILNDTKYDISDMIVQWHSHVMMSCSPSQPDRDLIQEALKLMPMIISIIVNCKGEYSAIAAFKRTDIFTFQDIVKLDAELVTYYQNPLTAKEVKKKLYKPAPPPPPKPQETHWHKGQFGKWANGVFVPENKNLPAPVARPEIYHLRPEQYYNNVDEELFPDYVIPAVSYKELLAYDEVMAIVHRIQADDNDINVWTYDDYAVLASETGNYVEVRPDEISANGVPMDWNNALIRLGVYGSQYRLIKKDAK